MARKVEGNVRTVLDWRGALAAGAALGIAIGLLARRKARLRGRRLADSGVNVVRARLRPERGTADPAREPSAILWCRLSGVPRIPPPTPIRHRSSS